MHTAVPHIVARHLDYSRPLERVWLLEIENGDLLRGLMLRAEIPDQNVAMGRVPTDFMGIEEPMGSELLGCPQVVNVKPIEMISNRADEAAIIGVPEVMGVGTEPVRTFFEIHGGLTGHHLHVVRVGDIEQHDLLAEIPQEGQLSAGRD
jgi:hypothetical protein